MFPVIVNLTLQKLQDRGFEIKYSNQGGFILLADNEFFNKWKLSNLKSSMDALSVASFLYLESQYKVDHLDIISNLKKEGIVVRREEMIV